MESKKLLQRLRAVLYMIKNGTKSWRKLRLDLQLLLKRSKVSGKALTNILSNNSNRNYGSAAAFSCEFMAPNASIYPPHEVEFSCSNTPLYPANIKQKNHRNSEATAAAAEIARAFEMLDEESSSDEHKAVLPSPSPSPSPAMTWNFVKGTPIMARRIRVTDSPFLIKEEELVDGGRVDAQAEDFIRRFYEQLKIQQRRM